MGNYYNDGEDSGRTNWLREESNHFLTIVIERLFLQRLHVLDWEGRLDDKIIVEKMVGQSSDWHRVTTLLS